MLIVLIPLTLALGAFVFDLTHMVTVTGELQSAVDAAALAGARDLTIDYSKCAADALTIAGHNFANGHPVANTSPETTVVVETTPPTSLYAGHVKVTASIAVHHFLARIFGRDSDVLTLSAVAGTGGTLRAIGPRQTFPLAVSIDTVPRDNDVPGVPLNQLRLGDTIHLYINSQQVKNAAFVAFGGQQPTAVWLRQAIDEVLGLEENPSGLIPPIVVGDVGNLTNGVDGGRILSQEPRLGVLLNQAVVTLPVVEGDPAFNGSRPIVGFVGIHVTDVHFGEGNGIVEDITGTIVKDIVSGASQACSTMATGPNNAALNRLSASAPVLLPNM
ncbi:MAG: hypothetical protein HY711_11730 [Candidatus Melainabacteria bacterium]|nr:hypothetical protein [Candidatus Melainabacteria bacterium]